MRLPDRVRRRFRLPLLKPPVADDVRAEIDFHLEAATQELIDEGWPPDAARAQALRRFGDVPYWAETISDLDQRRAIRMRRGERMHAVAQDLGQAARGLRRRPALVALVTLTFGLGIGANATVFGMIDRLLLRSPAHVTEPARVTRLLHSAVSPLDGRVSYIPRMDYARFAALRKHTRSFESLAAYFPSELTLGRGREATEAKGTLVTADFFPLLGVRPALGRFFSADEDRAGAVPTVVLGHEMWRSRFGGDSGAIGTTLLLQRSRYTVIGVAPPGFTGVELGRTDVWLPMHVGMPEVKDPRWAESRGSWLPVVGRLKAEVTRERAVAEATKVVRNVLEDGCRQWGPAAETCRDEVAALRIALGSVIPGRGPEESREARVSLLLAAVSAILLLIVCANVANLLFVRAMERRREVAVRLALGIGRRRLIAFLLAESLLLALLGGVAALLVAHWAGEAIRTALLPGVAWPSPPLDARVFVFTATAAAVSGLLAGIAPAIRSGRTDVAGALKLGGPGAVAGQRFTHSPLLVAQAALSVVLLVGAGLFVRSLGNIRSLDLGLDAERVLVASVDLRNAGYEPEEIREFYRRALSAVGALPQVERVSASRSQPFEIANGGMLRIPGRDSMPSPPTGGPYLYGVTPGYFATLGTRLLRGRDFTDGDRAGSQQAVIVNQALARLFWPAEDPLGRCVRVSGPDSTCAVVVGIVESARQFSVQEEAYLFYRSLAQYLEPPEALYVRPRGEPRAAATAVRQRLQSLERNLPYVDVRLVQELVDPQYQAWKLGAVMFGAMGALAFLVAMVGLYSVVAYGVARRTPEFGIRMAVGARAGDIVRLVLGGGLRYAVAGIALGVGIALAAGPAIASLLFEVSPRDPGIIAIVAIGLLAVATVACLVPAWRASRVDPAAALRTE